MDRVASVVGEVEQTTLGELVPMVVARSGRYRSASWRIAVSFSWAITAVAGCVFPEWTSDKILFMQLPLIWLGWQVAKFSPLLRRIVTRVESGYETHRHAVEAFYHHHLHRTTEQTGVLLFISRFERRVVILADEGIHAKVKDGTWEQVVQGMLPLVREDRLADALEYGAKACGKVLSEHFPSSGKKANQLSNRPIIED